MKRNDLEKRLRALNWYFLRHGKRHDAWSNGEREVAVPRHNEINEHTAKAIIKEAEGGNS